ncbi:hypothetical protein [Actinomadura macra]|uniref:hypothetical protein n=1 Tax=Actinomadura macra TaxID=46164 RepID=UPI00083451BB|nr:hypothetical protein [Actinomadura macra]
MNAGLGESARRRFDLTMLYAAYGAFRRDMGRMAAAGRTAGPVAGGTPATGLASPAVTNGWAVFKTHWLAQQAAERRALWTVMRGRLTGVRAEWLEAMESQAIRLVPLMDAVDAALEHGDRHVFGRCAHGLPASLEAHLDFKEANVLPLIHRTLTTFEWGTYDVELRGRIGVRGLRVFLPWLLDGASETTSGAVLRQLPPPVRVAHRTVWLPRYRRRDLWGH